MNWNLFKYLFPVVLLVSCSVQQAAIKLGHGESVQLGEEMYGMFIPHDALIMDEVQDNEFLSDILMRYDVDYPTIHRLATEFDTVFDVTKIRVGNTYGIVTDASQDSSNQARYFIYEENKVDYVVVDLGENLSVDRGSKPIEVVEEEASGVINSSLYLTLDEQNINPELAIRLSEVYAWTIDFYRIQKGDHFKVIYENKYVEEESIGLGQIKAVVFNHFGEDLYAFYHKPDTAGFGEYYDAEGNSLRRAFLQAPVKYSRISSPYQLNRVHPVTGKNKPHFGTDYAAPTGTPIYSTADGVITEARFKKYNGNYVKVKHNGTYTTQYLHMSKIAAGIKPGVHVRQGQTIGYVGSTGLATGPHVCYRFWKNGKQVDPYKEDLPKAVPLEGEDKEEFLAKIEVLKARLESTSFSEEPVVSVHLPWVGRIM